MYKIADKFKDTKVFYFQSTFNNHYDFSHCKSLVEVAQEILDDFSTLRHIYDTLNEKTQEEVINDAENYLEYPFALGYVEEVKEI